MKPPDTVSNTLLALPIVGIKVSLHGGIDPCRKTLIIWEESIVGNLFIPLAII
jgi:hypothetical protein